MFIFVHRKAKPFQGYLVEAFVAVWTLVALLCVVCLQMSHLGRGVRESLLAVVAVVWLLAAMHQLVALQIARSGEKLATNFTAVPRFPCVTLAMQVEQTDLTVALSASRAAVRLQGARSQRQLTLIKPSAEVCKDTLNEYEKVTPSTCVFSHGLYKLRGQRKPCCSPGS